MQKTIKPRVASLNRSIDWDYSMLLRAGRIYETCLIDMNRLVHCCEITPSYEAYLIQSFPLVDMDKPKFEGDDSPLESEIREADAQSGDVSYYHCSAIDTLPEDAFVDLDEVTVGDDETYEEAFERTLEYVRCNKMISTPQSVCWIHREIPAMLEKATRAYLHCALWSSNNDDSRIQAGAPENMDDEFDIEDIAESVRDEAKKDVETMLVHAATQFAKTPEARDIWDAEQLGHDFWLTRNRHGAGFWDRVSSGHPAYDFGQEMTNYAKLCGTVDLYVGDDNKVYA